MIARAAFPYALDSSGHTAAALPPDQVEQMLEQILFVMPGERVNRPDFGCALARLVFTSRSSELTTAIEALVEGALRKWAGDRIQIRDVAVAVQQEQVTVTVRYVDPRTQTVRQVRVSQ
jgi:phage baseplate assembly protein W